MIQTYHCQQNIWHTKTMMNGVQSHLEAGLSSSFQQYLQSCIIKTKTNSTNIINSNLFTLVN